MSKATKEYLYLITLERAVKGINPNFSLIKEKHYAQAISAEDAIKIVIWRTTDRIFRLRCKKICAVKSIKRALPPPVMEPPTATDH